MSLYTGLPLAAYGVIAVLAFLVIRAAPRRRANVLLALFLASMALWGYTIYGMRSSGPLTNPNLAQAYQWEKWVFTFTACAPVLYLHFAFAIRGQRLPTGWLVGLYGALAVFIILTHAGLIVTAMRMRSYGYAPVTTPLFLPYTLFITGSVTTAAIVLWRASTRLTGHERNRLVYMVIGPVGSLVGGFVDVAAAQGLPIYPLGIVGNMVFGLLASIAILKHQLLDIQVVIRRGTSYVLAGALATGLLIISHEILGNWFPVAATREIKAHLTMTLVLGFLIALGFHPFVEFLQGQTDRVFFRQRYVPIRDMETFASQTRHITDPHTLATTLVGLVVRAMRAREAFLVLPDRTDASRVLAFGADPRPRVLALPWDNVAFRWLGGSNEAVGGRTLHVSPQVQALPQAQSAALESLNGQLFVPLRSQNTLVAVLVVGASDRRRRFYSQEEVDLLEAVALQTAPLVENARLYEELRQNLEELRSTQDRLIRSAKLAAVGELAAGVAHEVNNPLQTILNIAYLLALDPRAVEFQRDLKLIEDEVLRARRIVQGLLGVARQGPISWSLDDVNARVRAVAQISEVRFHGTTVQLKTALQEDLPPVWADGQQLHQVFLNLINNAADAMPDGGTITVRTRRDGDKVIIQVEDTGKGIPPELLNRIFEPFFTTKAPGKGTGLGLAVSQGIIERHHGTISATSTVGAGTTFTITLPISEKNPSAEGLNVAVADVR